MKCAECGIEITETYLSILDNFIQAKFFDGDDDNIFCSQECLNKSLTIKELEVEEDC